jgi:signal transduction histidine kinase
VVTLAEPDARARHVSLNLHLPANLPKVRGDRVQLQQVVLNLVLNGMDAMNGAPRLERVVTVSAKPDGDGWAEVSVSDRGRGISTENLDRLFEPFFTTKTNGLGMGLAVSQTIVEAHGGKLWGGNNPPHGAIFKFTLPATKTAL